MGATNASLPTASVGSGTELPRLSLTGHSIRRHVGGRVTDMRDGMVHRERHQAASRIKVLAEDRKATLEIATRVVLIKFNAPLLTGEVRPLT